MMNNEDKYLSKKNQLSKIITNLLSFSDDLKHRDNQYVWLDDFISKLEEVEQKLKTQTFKVAVMAMMKSGKSTLINAILGNEFLPSANSAETLEVIQIEHDEQYKQGTLFGSNDEILAVSPANIKAKIRELNLLGRELNKSNQPQLLLKTDIQSFKKGNGSDVKFIILDTPGSNEKLTVINNSIKHLLNTTDVIVYLLDFTKLDFESGENIFEELKQLRTNLISDNTRLFFVINKIDELGLNDKEIGIANKEDIIKKVKDKYLKKDFENHIIIPVSAKKALYAGLMQSNNANEEQKDEFYTNAFGDQNKLFSAEIKLSILPQAIKNELESSNFEVLENQITNVLFEKSNNILLKSIKEDLIRLIENTIDKIEVEKSGLDKDEAEIKRLINKIESISDRLNKIQIPDEFKKKVNQIIKPNFDAFKIKINSIINSHFEGQSLHNPFIRRLREVLGFLYSYKKVNYQSEAEMHNHISDINNLFSSSIITEFEVFWNKIISDIYEEFSFLSDELKQKAVPIINEIQNELKKELNIRLFPYQKTAVQTDKYNFYHKLTYGTFDLITENKRWTLGWFFIFPYPKRYTESYTLNVSEYIQLLNEKTDEFLINQTNELLRNLSSNLEQVFQSSKNEISIYKDEYISVLQNSIIQKQKNGTVIAELVRQMSSDLNISRNTLKEIEDLFIEKMQNGEKQNITNIEKQYNINKIENASFE